MRPLIIIVLLLAVAILTLCLSLPLTFEFDLTWGKAIYGILPTTLLALACFVALLLGVGAKPGQRSHTVLWWSLALAWSLIVGGLLFLSGMSGYSFYSNQVSFHARESRPNIQSLVLYNDRVALYRTGMILGGMVLVFAGVSAAGLIVSIARRRKTVDAVS